MVQLDSIALNDNNPRAIRESKFERLKKSISEFPEMMKLRPMVIDEDGVLLGGNMRYRAIVALGYTEVPDEWVVKASELTEEQKAEFIVKDNVSYGEWDFEELGNKWEAGKLFEWGMDVSVPKNNEADFGDDDDEDEGTEHPSLNGLATSHVRMVQLFLTEQTEPEFREWEESLREHFGTDNLTDTVYEALKHCSKTI